MDLTHLRYFQVTAASKSMSEAARKLGISQPTLTVAIRHLEKHLSTTLFLRERNGVRLTSTGDVLLRHATNLLSLIEHAEQDVRGLESEEVGSFVIGCHESLGAYFLPGFMSSFLQEAPRIELTLWNGPSASVTEAVIDRRVNFGLVVNVRPHPDLVIVPIFEDAVDFFVAAPPAGAPPVTELAGALQRLRTEPLIFAGRVFQSQELLDLLAKQKVVPSRLLSCGDLELVKSLTLANLGVGVIPRRVAAYGQEGRLRRLHPALPFFPDTISLVYRADGHRTRAALRLKEALARYGRSLGASQG
ncbi:LysR family transcriptional regulator [Hyalangium sp.]|uniref:LysR family transcriptional regulator n=1 Tax=Hyalangium sp. TaxID=2028555 RepID=UPI002D261175|nr:LysR family transcriptional regulator [Hyalangium sp.]HYH99166.1 LysR family transcriptional regulator [Hyalangium sp.]